MIPETTTGTHGCSCQAGFRVEGQGEVARDGFAGGEASKKPTGHIWLVLNLMR